MPARTYLDHNATTPVLPAVREAMARSLALTGNPSSVHAEGRAARAATETARAQVAALVGARPHEIVFTSGGTEANNLGLAAGWGALIISAVEHDSVLAPARAAASPLTLLPVDADGRVSSDVLADTLARLPAAAAPPLVSIQLANNETGVVQPLADLSGVVRAHNRDAILHVDAVQAAGKIPVDREALGADLLSLSAHKLGGPQGVGALVVRDGVRIPALLTGGGQELGYRAGTQNVPGIVGFGVAAAAARASLSSYATHAADLRARLETGLRQVTPDAIVIAADAPRLPNTTCVALPGRAAETLVIALDLAGIGVSAGAACSSGKVSASHVLAAMGLPPDLATSAIRISTGRDTLLTDIDAFLRAWRAITYAHTADAPAPARRVA